MNRLFLLVVVGLAVQACYDSTLRGNGGDAAEDPGADPVGEDAVVDPAGEETPPPAYDIDFIIENGSHEACSSCVIYLDFTFGLNSQHDLGITYEEEVIMWHPPDCTVSCASVTDPTICCIGCAAPLPAVKVLIPGQSVTIHWGGHDHVMDYEVCECGCYDSRPVGPGAGMARACAYRSYECVPYAECEHGEDGVVLWAETSGDPVCVEQPFSFPQDDGGDIRLVVEAH